MNVKTAARAYGLTINEQPDIVIGAGDAILGKCTKTSIGLADGDESLAAIEPDLDAVCLSVSDVFQLDGKNQLRTQDMLTENKRLIGIQLVSDREEPGFGTFPSFYPIGRDRSAYGQHRTRAGNPCRGVSANLTRNPSPIDTHSIFPFVGSVLNVAVPSLPAEGPTRKEKPMNTKDYGHHASGYRKADGGPSRKFMRGLAVLAVVLAFCFIWLMTHPACATPLANGICSLMGFGFVPLRLIALVLSEAGVE